MKHFMYKRSIAVSLTALSLLCSGCASLNDLGLHLPGKTSNGTNVEAPVVKINPAKPIYTSHSHSQTTPAWPKNAHAIVVQPDAQASAESKVSNGLNTMANTISKNGTEMADATGKAFSEATAKVKEIFYQVTNPLGRDPMPQVHLTRVQFQLNMPSSIVMQKQAVGAIPIITKTDKREALLTAQAQLSLLQQGLHTKFQQKALQYGLNIVPMSADIIHADIESIYSFCQAAKGCKTRLNVNIKVTDLENKVIWSYGGSLEQAQPKDTVNEPMFDAFADMVLHAMSIDGLIGPQSGK